MEKESKTISGAPLSPAELAPAILTTGSDFVVGIHPRLHMWPSPAPDGITDQARLRDRIKNGDAPIKAMWERILRLANQAVDEGPIVAVPKTMGADPARTLNRVWALGLAYRVTGDAVYADAARLQARAMAEDWCEWIHPESETLFSGHKLFSDLRTGIAVHAMGLIYDWFYDQLDADDRATITRAIRERGFARWLKDRTALTQYKSNWCVEIAGGMGVAAMATLESIPESAMIAALAAEHVPRMLEGFGADGGWEEGLSYWDGTSLLIEYLDALRTATAGRVNYLADSRLRRTCWFPLFFTMPPDGLADFADAYYTGGFRPMSFAAVAAANRDSALQWACRQAMARGCDPAEPQTLLMYDSSVEAQAPGTNVGLSKVFRDVGLAAIRNGWGDADDRPVIAAKAGDNRHGGNQHLDVGNVIVSAGGGKLLSDHGYGNGRPAWTWNPNPDAQGRSRWTDPLYSTPGHNVVVIGARNQRLEGAGIVSSHHDDGAVAVVSLDCTGAYEGARSAIRTVFHRRPDLLIVVDAVSLERPEPAWLSWHVPAVPMTQPHPDESAVAACLPVVQDGVFHVESPRYRLTGICLVVEGGEPVCAVDAHRRFGMVDTFGDYKPMPNTIYPYVQTQSGFAREHLFLSAFLIRPTAMARNAEWARIVDGLALKNGTSPIRITIDRERGVLKVIESETGWRFQTSVR